MQVCVCGWYYWPSLMKLLPEINEKWPVTIVAHRTDPALHAPGMEDINYVMRENRGCEYGAYDHFIKNQWDGESSVFFMHDDIELKPLMRDYEIISPIAIFESISQLPYDLCYIFKSYEEQVRNCGIHGRGIFMSGRFISRCLEDNDGIWWDPGNDGHIMGPTPDHCKHFNEADYIFQNWWKKQEDYAVGEYVIIPSFNHANRGGAWE